MRSLLSDMLPILVLFALGAAGGGLGLLDKAIVGGLRKLVAKLTLPVLLFSVFASTRLEPRHLLLACAVFVSCGLMGLAGKALSGPLRLPSPASVHLFQGFEAGMLGYALYSSLFGAEGVSRFALADLGQVLYVFTVLMAQMKRPEASAGAPGVDQGQAGVRGVRVFLSSLLSLLRDPVVLAILLGLLCSLVFGQSPSLPWASAGLLWKTLSLVGGLTTPLVCLSVGYGLSQGFKGSLSAAVTVATRMVLAVALSLALILLLFPALGIGGDFLSAVAVLFLLPPPFVISIYRGEEREASYVSSVLSLHTVVSLIAVFLFATLTGGRA